MTHKLDAAVTAIRRHMYEVTRHRASMNEHMLAAGAQLLALRARIGFVSGRVSLSREFSLNSARITFSEWPFPSKKAFPLMPSGRHFTSFPLIIAKPPWGSGTFLPGGRPPVNVSRKGGRSPNNCERVRNNSRI